MVGSTSMQGGMRAAQWSEPLHWRIEPMATGYVPWAREKTEDMVEEKTERTRRRRETVKTFAEGVSLEEASVSIGRVGRAIEGED